MIFWGVWFFYVDHMFVLHGHEEWAEGRKSPSGLLAAMIFWPVAWACWRLAYPLDGWVFPWHHKFESVEPDEPTAEEIDRSVRELALNVADRLSAEDQDTIAAFIEGGDLKAAIEHMVINLVASDSRVTKAEGEMLLDLAIPLDLDRQAGRDLHFLAKQM